jgi:very-short-patch-repair endonuclease
VRRRRPQRHTTGTLGLVMTAAPRRRLTRPERARIGAQMAARHGGVAHRRHLRAAGVTRADVRTEVDAGRWVTAGVHTVAVTAGELTDEAQRWRAVWESGAGAVLDGVSALHAAGLTGFTADVIDVSVPRANRRHLRPGVRSRRRAAIGPVVGAGIPRTTVEYAAIRAAGWAHTDRTAVLILCLVVQQRLTHPARLRAAWSATRRSPRRALLEAVIRDICDGAHSLGELDFARWCRACHLPEPSRQVVRHGPKGRVYLDVEWADVGLVVEIDGGHHQSALGPVDDALRQNDVAIAGRMVLRIPVLGLRLDHAAFMGQVVRAYMALRDRTGVSPQR